MSRQISVLIRRGLTLVEIFTHAESLVERLPGSVSVGPLRIDGALAAAAIDIGPFDIIAGSGQLRSYASWALGRLDVCGAADARVGLTVTHEASDEELGLSMEGLPDDRIQERNERAGYQVAISIYRSEPSMCLAALLACSIAALNQARIVDDEGLLAQPNDLVDPSVVCAMFDKHGNSSDFAELSHRFCADIGYSAR